MPGAAPCDRSDLETTGRSTVRIVIKDEPDSQLNIDLVTTTVVASRIGGLSLSTDNPG